jgi:hypothetical protein
MASADLSIRPAGAPLRERLLWPFVLLCAAGSIAAVALAGTAAVAGEPLTFVLLVMALVVLDAVGTGLSGNGHTAPTTVPSIALALLFGPAGAVGGEAALRSSAPSCASPRSAMSSTSGRSAWPASLRGSSPSRCRIRGWAP